VPGCYEDLDQADLLVLAGSNAAWCHPVLYQRMLANKQNRGARIVVIDPRRTDTAGEADLFLGLKPGSDTALFSDLQLISEPDPVDIALMCIGGHYTMDRIDGVRAAKLIGAGTVIPCHYGTFPPIETDAQAYKTDVQNAGFAEVIVLDPGTSHEL